MFLLLNPSSLHFYFTCFYCVSVIHAFLVIITASIPLLFIIYLVISHMSL